MRGPPLDMAGTARVAWLEADGRSSTLRGLYQGPDFDLARLEGIDGGRRLLQLAWELARLAEEPEARRTLLTLGLAMLIFGQRGSTTAPLSGDGRKVLDALLLQLEPDAARRAGLEALLAGGPIPKALQPFIGAEGARPLLLTKHALSLHRLARLEDRLAEELATQLAQKPLVDVGDVEGAWKAVKATSLKWNEEQQRALLNAVHLPFTVISGGPGTGKTTIVVSLLRLLVRLGVDPAGIALAAPTGKAANRMFEEVGKQLEHAQHATDTDLRLRLPEPRTLHRLLGYSPGRDRFSRDEHNPLEQDVVIVDESSMVDLFLMERLFRAARPRSERPRRLILLGDANQLPSIEAGMVLSSVAEETAPLRRPWHALIDTHGDPPRTTYVPKARDPRARFLTTLTQSIRMDPTRVAGNAIYRYAEAIRRGQTQALAGPLLPPARAQATALAFTKVEHLPTFFPPQGRASLEDFFKRWWQERWEGRTVRVDGQAVPLPALWDEVWRFENGALDPTQARRLSALLSAVESQRILCLTRGSSPTGAQRANDWFAARRRDAAASREGSALMAGEPVLFLVNDYHLKLFNGDHGVVARTSLDGGPERLRVLFPRAKGVEAFELSAVSEHLQRAYALTVHKAQGSQVECAALLLPTEEDSPLLVRQLVYTAVSRASESVILVGELERLYRAVDNPVQRFSAVMEKTEAALG